MFKGFLNFNVSFETLSSGERGITFGDRLDEEPTTKNLTLLQSVVFLFFSCLRKRAIGAQ